MNDSSLERFLKYAVQVLFDLSAFSLIALLERTSGVSYLSAVRLPFTIALLAVFYVQLFGFPFYSSSHGMLNLFVGTPRTRIVLQVAARQVLSITTVSYVALFSYYLVIVSVETQSIPYLLVLLGLLVASLSLRNKVTLISAGAIALNMGVLLCLSYYAVSALLGAIAGGVALLSLVAYMYNLWEGTYEQSSAHCTKSRNG